MIMKSPTSFHQPRWVSSISRTIHLLLFLFLLVIITPTFTTTNTVIVVVVNAEHIITQRRTTSATSNNNGAGSSSSSSSSSSSTSNSNTNTQNTNTNNYFDEMYKSTREEVLATREDRKLRLIRMIDEMEQQLHNHATGIRRLNEHDRSTIERKRVIYNRKLDTMLVELDFPEVDRILAREEIRAELVQNRIQRKLHDEL